jgi:ubiquilin
MFENPAMRQSFDEMLADSNIMESLIAASPELASAMEANPQLREIISDPQAIRDVMNLMNNPGLLAEQQRANDRAMANISMQPGGFDALAQHHRNVLEPMERAMRESEQARAGDSASATTASNIPSDGPLPNPWGGGANTNGTPGGALPFGAGGLMGDFAGPDGSMMDRESAMRLLESPMMESLQQTVMSNPAWLQQMLNNDPRIRELMESNPQMRQVVNNPEMLRQIVNPANIRAMMQADQALTNMGGGSLFGDGMGGAGMFGAPSVPAGPPEQVYATQLSQLNDMGFFDSAENIRALQATGGNVHAAVERLLSSNGGMGGAY